MSDQNRFDPYKQKLLHYWALFLAGCGTLWEKVKRYCAVAVDFLRRYGKVLAQKLTEFGKAAAQWLREMWTRVRPYIQRLLQTLAAWLLLAKEKSGPVIARTKELLASAIEKTGAWLRSVKERLPMPDKTLPAPEEARALPAGGEDMTDAEAAEIAEEPEPVPVKTPSRNLPAWMSHPWVAGSMTALAAVWTGIKFVVKWICKLYKLILAAPVVWFAVKFAMENMERLPEQVGLDIQSTGEFARMISRQQAVYWPFGITMFCLVLMFISKKPILPWIISIFTLVLPWLIWLLNFYA